MNELFEDVSKTNDDVGNMIEFWNAAEEFAGMYPKVDYYLRFHIVATLSGKIKSH